MGLDMYLTRIIFIGGCYANRKVTGKVAISIKGQPVKVAAKNIDSIITRVGYWRNANAVHHWFVNNYAGGIDDCTPICLNASDLIKLRNICQSILNLPSGAKRNRQALKLLPPKDGPAFNSGKIDDRYYDDLELTVEILQDIPEDDPEYYEYRASW